MTLSIHSPTSRSRELRSAFHTSWTQKRSRARGTGGTALGRTDSHHGTSIGGDSRFGLGVDRPRGQAALRRASGIAARRGRRDENREQRSPCSTAGLSHTRIEALEARLSDYERGLVFPGEPNARGERGPIDADTLLRHILRRALRRAGLPALRFHDLRHMAGTLMHEAGVSLKRAQEILGHASERTTLAIYTHSMRRTHDDSADKIAILAGLAPASQIPGNKLETSGSVKPQESAVSDCLIGSRGWNRTNDQRINSPSLYR
jgi:hypothetical protein